MSEPGEARTEYVGRSLAYVRMLVGAKAHYPDAKAAAADLHLGHSDPPPLGAICWFGSEPFGNCGLYVGDRLVLSVNRSGQPVLWPLPPHGLDERWGGDYLGWCPAKALREAAEPKPMEPHCRRGNALKYHTGPCSPGCEYPGSDDE